MGAEDALRDAAKQVQRNPRLSINLLSNNPYMARLHPGSVMTVCPALIMVCWLCCVIKALRQWDSTLAFADNRIPSERSVIVPPARARYLAEIAETVRVYHKDTQDQVRVARKQQLQAAAQMLGESRWAPRQPHRAAKRQTFRREQASVGELVNVQGRLSRRGTAETSASGKEIRTRLGSETLSGNWILRVALPEYEDDGEILKFIKRENLPGFFPFTAGVFPFKREGEDPARMFAGEGDPARTNRRFKNFRNILTPNVFRRHLIASRSMVLTLRLGQISTARLATPVFRSLLWTI